MLSLTIKTDYALVALAHLGIIRSAAGWPGAMEGEAGASARGIAECYHLPLPLMMNILKWLSKASIVSSTRGPQGGYELAVDPKHLTVMQVLHTMEGPIRMAPCCDEPAQMEQGCDIAWNCPISQPIRRLHAKLQGFFEQLTLADMLETETESYIDVTLEQVGV